MWRAPSCARLAYRPVLSSPQLLRHWQATNARQIVRSWDRFETLRCHTRRTRLSTGYGEPELNALHPPCPSNVRPWDRLGTLRCPLAPHAAGHVARRDAPRVPSKGTRPHCYAHPETVLHFAHPGVVTSSQLLFNAQLLAR